jgi:flagella basal body P-ring formation protein FlgA
VLLHCVRGPVAWRIALPVTVQVWAPAWVAARPRTAGEKLAADHVVPGVVDWAAAATPPLPLSQPVTGRMLARALDAGAPLREADLRSRQWFAAGDTVRVTARGSGFSVQAEAQALTPGFEGLPARLQAANGGPAELHPHKAGGSARFQSKGLKSAASAAESASMSPGVSS